jgi:hypothetical protein
MSGVVFIQTVEENKKLYTAREVAAANRAREVYELLIYPSIGDFINIIRFRMIRDCRISVEDVKRMLAIYGPHVIQGKGNGHEDQ